MASLVRQHIEERKLAIKNAGGKNFKVTMDPEDFKNLWELMKDEFELFHEFFRCYDSERDLVVADPRLRSDRSKKQRCVYHCHAKDAPCHLYEEEESADWVYGIETEE